MDDVAREAHVHRTTVYRYFAGRDEILLGILLRETEALIHQAAEAIDDAPEFGEGLVRALLLSARTIRENPHLHRLYGTESGAEVTRAAAASLELAERTRATLMLRLERAARRGELRAGLDPEEVPGGCGGWSTGSSPTPSTSPPGQIERMLRTFTGLGANPPPPKPGRKRSPDAGDVAPEGGIPGAGSSELGLNPDVFEL